MRPTSAYPSADSVFSSLALETRCRLHCQSQMGSSASPVSEAIDDLTILANGASVSLLSYRKDTITNYLRKIRNGRHTCSNNIVSNNADYVVRRYGHILQGENWKDVPARLMRNYADRFRCHTGIYRRLREDEPAVVIGNFRKNMLIHPTQDR